VWGLWVVGLWCSAGGRGLVVLVLIVPSSLLVIAVGVCACGTFNTSGLRFGVLCRGLLCLGGGGPLQRPTVGIPPPPPSAAAPCVGTMKKVVGLWCSAGCRGLVVLVLIVPSSVLVIAVGMCACVCGLSTRAA